MFTLNAFYQAALAASSVEVIVPAVLDQSVNVQNSRFQFPADRTLLGGWAAGTSISLAELDSASLNINGRPVITPIDVAAPGGNLPGLEWYGPMGYTLPGLELIGMLASTDASGAADTYGGIWSTRGLKPVSGGRIRTIRCTATAAGAKGSWFISPLTFITALSAGKYTVVGMNVVGANAALARLVWPNSTERPGCPAVSVVSSYVLDYFRGGKIGEWGTFDNYNPPQIEVLGFGTIATQTVYLDLIKVA